MTPSLLDLPQGCAFRPRCPRADEACLLEPPLERRPGRTSAASTRICEDRPEEAVTS